MNHHHQQQQQLPGTQLHVLSVCDIDDNELFSSAGAPAGWMMRPVHGGRLGAMAAVRQVLQRPTGTISHAVATFYDDDDATHNDVL